MKRVWMKKRNTLSFEKQNQALSRTAKGMEDLAGAQIKRTKLMIEADKKKKWAFSYTQGRSTANQ